MRLISGEIMTDITSGFLICGGRRRRPSCYPTGGQR